jgi:thioredoxin reductase (NADPH)
MAKDKNFYHLIIVGAGPAGLSASIYAQRAGVDTLVFEKLAPGGQILTSDKIENYPGFPHPISTQELISRILQQAKNCGMELKHEEVEKVEIGEDKTVYTDSGSMYKAHALVLATGAFSLPLGVPGEKEFRGKGVSYCATCDASFFKNQRVAVVGGGDAAAKEALYLTRFAQKVYLLHRRNRLRAEKALQVRVLHNEKIEILWDTILERIYGNQQVQGIVVQNLRSGESKNICCEGVFIYVGLKPNSDFVKGQINLDQKGFILTNEKMETNIPGVFACGDVRRGSLKQVVVACSEGAQAAFMAGKYLEEEGVLNLN